MLRYKFLLRGEVLAVVVHGEEGGGPHPMAHEHKVSFISHLFRRGLL